MKIEEMLDQLESAAKECDCGNPHNQISIETMMVGHDAFEKCANFLSEKEFKRVLLIADDVTYEVAGAELANSLKDAGIDYSICLIEPNQTGDVVADEASIVQALIEIGSDIDSILAVGSGTIHDISRFCSAKSGKPFISIPTAASVDGFTSIGAPIIVRGVKKTFKAVSPLALFASIDVLMNAPKKMTAAGVGDMLAKFTSLADWNFGQLVYNEPFCPLVASITRQSLDDCIHQIDQIAAGEEDGIRSLMTALIQSGLAMLLFGQSHSASGGEHHLSHYWEMEFLQKKRPQVLHGAKVGVSSIMLAKLYREWLEDGTLLPNALQDRTDAVKTIVKTIPTSSTLVEILEKAGGPTTAEALGIDEKLVQCSLEDAYLLRDRFTMLKCFNINIDNRKPIQN